MKREYIRDGFAPCLSHAIEEAGEFLAAAGKTARFGLFKVNPELSREDQETNHDWMMREMRDLRGALLRLGRAMQQERQKHEEFERIIARNRRQRPGY